MKPEIARRYIETGKIKFVWHDFAWIGNESRQSAQGARCAGRQGKFWQYHDHLYANQRGDNQGQFSPANLRRFAGAVGLDEASFGSCLEKGEDLPALQQELTVGRQSGISVTPYFRINGQPLAGARGIDDFTKAIDAELKRLGQ